MELLGRDIVRERLRHALELVGAAQCRRTKGMARRFTARGRLNMEIAARAVVLAAGMGTRMKSSRPKVLHEICGRPMLWYTLRALAAAGVRETIVVTNAAVDPLVAPLIAGFGARSVIQEPQLGTGHAVQTALRALAPARGTIVVAYGDMPLVAPQIFTDVLIAGTRMALA